MTTAGRALRQLRGQLPGLPIDAALCRVALGGSTTPGASYAVECALLDLQSRLAGVPLRRWLLGSHAEAVSDWIELNAVLGPAIRITEEGIALAVESGYRVLKVKVACADPDTEIEHLARLSRALPTDARLRLDANGGWDLDTAGRVIAALSGLPIESLEEPLDRPDSAGLARLQDSTPFPLALDESLVRWAERDDSGPFPVRRAVIKPAVMGGVAATLGLAGRLRRLGIEVVLTGIIDSAAGLWATAQVSAAAQSPIPQGLATSAWLARDLGPPPIPKLGRLALPDAPGSGFEPFHAGGGA